MLLFGLICLMLLICFIILFILMLLGDEGENIFGIILFVILGLVIIMGVLRYIGYI